MGDTLDLGAGRAPEKGHGDAALGLRLTLGEGKVVQVQPLCASEFWRSCFKCACHLDLPKWSPCNCSPSVP